ncbi:hypothetical protein Tco_0449312 [Tanacetum coccineum]
MVSRDRCPSLKLHYGEIACISTLSSKKYQFGAIRLELPLVYLHVWKLVMQSSEKMNGYSYQGDGSLVVGYLCEESLNEHAGEQWAQGTGVVDWFRTLRKLDGCSTSVKMKGALGPLSPRVLASLLKKWNWWSLICTTLRVVIPFKFLRSDLPFDCSICLFRFGCSDPGFGGYFAIFLLLASLALEVVVKSFICDNVCLRNGGLISWRLINLGSMKLILTEIGLVKISTSILVEIALPVLVKVIPPIEIVSIISLRVLKDGWKTWRSWREVLMLGLLVKSNARTISIVQQHQMKTAWVEVVVLTWQQLL